MNTIRMIAIALPMTLLIACGGGGGGGAAAPTTPPTMLAPTCSNDCEDLPDYHITDLSVSQNRIGGTAPASMTETAIILQLREIATTADTLQIGDTILAGSAGFGTDIKSSCSGKSCTVNIPNVDQFTFSLTDIEDFSTVDDTANLVGFDAETRVVVNDNNITFAESRSAARQDDGTQLSFQSYGGWLDDSAFGTILLNVTESGTTTNRFTSFSFGKKSGSNPAGSGRAEWSGSAVGTGTDNNLFWQKDVTVDIDDLENPDVDLVISGGGFVNETRAGFGNTIKWENMTLTNGVFQRSSGEENIWGSFYGDKHGEVGGTFDTDNLVGAFGATRQP